MRDSRLKTLDIKAFMKITSFLGRLGIKECYRSQHPTINPITMKPISPVYGFGLKETKDLVERMFNYSYQSKTPLNQLSRTNEIHMIKRTHLLVLTLIKLGLQTPNNSIFECREFVIRQRKQRR